MDTSSSYLLKLSFAIFGPVLIISGLAIFVIFLMRRTHHKRLLATRSKQDPETYYASDDFRATSAGDSTMKVVLLDFKLERNRSINLKILCRNIYNIQ